MINESSKVESLTSIDDITVVPDHEENGQLLLFPAEFWALNSNAADNLYTNTHSIDDADNRPKESPRSSERNCTKDTDTHVGCAQPLRKFMQD